MTITRLIVGEALGFAGFWGVFALLVVAMPDGPGAREPSLQAVSALRASPPIAGERP